MEVGWGGEGGMVGNIGFLASYLSHLTRHHRPQKDILPINIIIILSPSLGWWWPGGGLESGEWRGPACYRAEKGAQVARWPNVVAAGTLLATGGGCSDSAVDRWWKQ